MSEQTLDKGCWLPIEDKLILDYWGMGMQRLRELMPHKTESDIFGRRVFLLKSKGVEKI